MVIFTISITFTLLMFASTIIPPTMGVDRSKFKNCEQSSFCQRNRNHKPFEQKWTLDMSTIEQNDRDIVGQLFDADSPKDKLFMVLSLTQKGAIRMKIDQLDQTRRRYEPVESLNPKLTFSKLQIESKTDTQCVFSFGTNSQNPNQKYKLTIHSSPFRADVTNAEGEIIVLVNSRGLMRFEIHKEFATSHIKHEMFGAPRQARAYDEAGRPIDDQTSELAESQEQVKADQTQIDQSTNDKPQADQTQNDQPQPGSETLNHAETFSTFTDHRPYGPMSVGMDIYFPLSDHVYGIPEHADDFNLKDTRPNIGDPYRLYNVDIFEYETYSPMSLYGAIPFMMAQSKSVGTFGVFWLNPSETWIDIESNHSQSRAAGVVDMISSFVSSEKKMTGRLTHWFSETGLIDVWFMPGPDPPTVAGYNAEIFGTIPMPPVYSTGFHQCRWNYYSTEEVMQVNNNYDAVDVPLDSIWLDIEYTQARSKRYFTWDPVAFHDHIEMANNLTSKGRRLIALIDPHIKKEDGYYIYDEGNSLDIWVKDSSGQNTYEGWCWPGASVWPDYLDPKVRDWWSTKFEPSHFPGQKDCLVDIWNDMNEPSVFNGPEVTAPRDLVHFGGFEHRDIHNIYGFMMTKATHEGLTKYRTTDRPFILTRSFFAGSQRYCAAWTGDNQARWDHLKISVPMLLSLSVAGMPNVGADVGGFFNNPEEELLVRWHQAGAFQPFFRSHAHHDARHREAYQYKGQTLDLLRAAIRLRYSYSPFWYSLFFEAHNNGLPMMRPLWFHESNDEKAYSIEDQYLLGYELLVKPVLDKGVTSIDVYLPGSAGQTAWFDLNNHIMHQGGKTITSNVDIRIVPLFQRAGTIIPRQYRMRRSLELLIREPITLDIVLGESQAKTYAHGSYFVDQYRNLEPNDTSATVKDLLYFDENLYIKPSTQAQLSHGLIERIIIYNWPVHKKIKSIKVAPEENNYSDISSLEFRLDQPRADGTVLLEIKRPQLSSSWRTWMLRIDV